jgi:hypothetical protein
MEILSMFDALSFLRSKGLSQITTVTAHKCKIRLTGMPTTYTKSGILALTEKQTEACPVSTPAREVDNGISARTKLALTPTDCVTFIGTREGQEVKSSKAEQRASAPPATNTNGQTVSA